MSRKTAQIYHTRKKFWQRFSIRITPEEQVGLVDQIQNHRSLFICRISKWKSNHVIELRGELYLVGYDRGTKQIATVLPAERLDEIYPKVAA